jgi:HEAT repeat protein
MTDFLHIRATLQSADEEIRRSVLHLLDDFSSAGARDILFAAMGDESWRVRKEAVDLFVHSKPDTVTIERVVNLLRAEENAGLRNSAAEAVIRLGAASISPLISMVQDTDDDVRKSVIDIMGAIGDPVFVPCLLQALQDPEVNVASAAAEQLGALGDAGAVEQLIAAVLKREDVLFRFSALGSLGRLAKPVAVPKALLQLADQQILKKAVFDCLGAIADDSSISLLLRGLSSPQKNSRTAAVKALYKVYGRSSAAIRAAICAEIQQLGEHDTSIGLLELFDTGDTVLMDALIWVGSMSRDPRFIPVLLEAYSGECSDSSAALSALKDFGQDAVRAVIPNYSRHNENVRSGLCLLIAECGYSGFSDLIEVALRDPSAQVQKAAVFAVGALGLTTLVPDLISLLDVREAGFYSTVISSLETLAVKNRNALVVPVEQLCSSPVSQHRRAAAHLLASLGVSEQLLLLVKDEDSQVRATAISALGASQILSFGSTLLLALSDESPDVRIAAADALGTIQDPTTTAALERALDDEDAWVRSAVLRALAKIEPTRAVAIIKRLHADSKGLFLITSLQILEDIGGSDAEEIIRHALLNNNRDISRQAAKSLVCFTDTGSP